MLTLSRFFMLFLLCNATSALHSMEKHDLHNAWDDNSDAVRCHIEAKNLTKHKRERHKKRQGLSSKQKHIQAARTNNKKVIK